MSEEAFGSCERRYCELSADLSKKTYSIGRILDGEQRKHMISEIKGGLKEADALIRKMDFEAGRVEANHKGALLAKIIEYKSDLNNLKSEARRTASTQSNLAARNDLLEGRMANTASDNQRDRLLLSTEKLNSSGKRIEESRSVMVETEQIGVSLLQDFHQQRQSLIQADNTLQDMDEKVDRSKGIIVSMSRRMSRNKWIIASLVMLLLLVICFILYSKLAK